MWPVATWSPAELADGPEDDDGEPLKVLFLGHGFQSAVKVVRLVLRWPRTDRFGPQGPSMLRANPRERTRRSTVVQQEVNGLAVRREVRDGTRKSLEGSSRLVRTLQGHECTDATSTCVTEYSSARKMQLDARRAARYSCLWSPWLQERKWRERKKKKRKEGKRRETGHDALQPATRSRAAGAVLLQSASILTFLAVFLMIFD